MSFENVSCLGRIENFFQGGGTNFRHFFQAQFFPAKLIISNLSNKKALGRSGGMLPPKKFLTFAYCNGYFSAF